MLFSIFLCPNQLVVFKEIVTRSNQVSTLQSEKTTTARHKSALESRIKELETKLEESLNNLKIKTQEFTSLKTVFVSNIRELETRLSQQSLGPSPSVKSKTKKEKKKKRKKKKEKKKKQPQKKKKKKCFLVFFF